MYKDSTCHDSNACPNVIAINLPFGPKTLFRFGRFLVRIDGNNMPAYNQRNKVKNKERIPCFTFSSKALTLNQIKDSNI